MSRVVVSVSELATAVACPRLLYLHRRAGGPTFRFETGRSFALGRLFHGWLADLVRQARGRGRLAQTLRTRSTAEAAAEALRERLYRTAYFPWLQGQGSRQVVAEVVLLWDSLSEVAAYLGELLAAAAARDLPPSRVLLGAEIDLAHRLRRGGRDLELRGTVDTLVHDPRNGRLCILDFKTRPDCNAAADLIQLAAYTWLLEKKTGARADGALVYFTPRLQVAHFPQADLERAVGSHIPDVIAKVVEWTGLEGGAAAALPAAADARLCAACPHHPPCPDRFPAERVPAARARSDDRAGARPQPTRPRRARRAVRPAPTPQPPGQLPERLAHVLADFNCPVEPLGCETGPTFIRCRLRPAPGVAVAAILKRDEDLRVQLGLSAVPLIHPGPGYVSVDVPREDRQFVTVGQVLERLAGAPRPDGLCLPLGLAVDGHLVTADLADPATCHFLIGGTPGSGKSEFLKSVAVAAAARYTPDEARLILIDPKQVTFAPFAALPHLQGEAVTDPEEAVSAIEALGDEMDRRYGLFRRAGAQDLAGYRAGGRTDLPRLLVLFDEFGDCMLRHPRLGKALEAATVRLGQMARAAGIHLMLATQKPVVKVVTGLIKGNLPGRIAFRVASRADSQVILDSDDAAHLLGRGDMIAHWAGASPRLQSPHVPGADLRTLLEELRSAPLPRATWAQ